jgi:AcrR family transcriptional regulator
MGTKERKKRERNMRRQQIQDAAKELFLKKGFNSTTIEEIAECTELALGTIYYYFKNKDELYISLILLSVQYLLDELQKISARNDLNAEEKLFEVKEALYHAYDYDPLIFRNIVHMQVEQSLLSIDSELVDKINSQARKAFNLMASFYEEGVSQGKFIEGHPAAHADIMWGLFTGVLLWEASKKKFNKKRDFIKSTLDTAFDAYVRGIMKNKD